MAARALHLILLAGGQGLRAGAGELTPKQFRPTGRGLLFTVSLLDFLTLDEVTGHRPADTVITVSEPWRETAGDALADCDIPWSLASAGQSRTESTWNAVRQMAAEFNPRPEDLVAVHDAARPFASPELLARLCTSASESGGAVPGIAVPDTIVQSTDDGAEYLERSTLVAVQTPQVFHWGIFEAAHAWAAGQGHEFTDDGGLMASRGHQPVVVPGEQDNWKVTTADDWDRAVAILGAS